MPCNDIVGDEVQINVLPDELILHIFKLLTLDDILSCENVCQRWRKLSHDLSVWRNILIIYSCKPCNAELSKKNLEILLSHHQYICCIKMQYVYDYSLVISLLQKCEHIVSLELVMCGINKEFVEDLNMWPKLRKLNLKNSVLLPCVSELISFENFHDLRYLVLADFGLSSVNCSMLSQCPHLSHIFIEKIKNLKLEDIRLLIISRNKILKSFHIYGGEAVDDKCMQLISQCPHLNDLGIIRSENLTDIGLLSFGNLKEIEHLQVWNNVLFSEMALLSTLGNPNLLKLITLSLSRIENVSPVVVDVISEHYKRLKFLALYQCPKIIGTDYEKQLKSKFRNIDVVLY